MILQSTSFRLKKSQSSTTETVIIIHVPDRILRSNGMWVVGSYGLPFCFHLVDHLRICVCALFQKSNKPKCNIKLRAHTPNSFQLVV